MPELPDNYWDYLESEEAVSEGFADGFPGYFVLWDLEEAEKNNLEIGIDRMALGFLGFGGNGGGELLAFDHRGSVYCLPLIGMEPRYAAKSGGVVDGISEPDQARLKFAVWSHPADAVHRRAFLPAKPRSPSVAPTGGVMVLASVVAGSRIHPLPNRCRAPEGAAAARAGAGALRRECLDRGGALPHGGVMRRPFPDLLYMSTFPELNVRTYVTADRGTSE